MNALDILKERGFVKQCSNETVLKKLFDSSKMVFYVGFDATADSLHIGNLFPIMAMAHLQKAGHTPIALIGGGTTFVGDPSGKDEMRKIIAPAEIKANGQKILAQLKRYLEIGKSKGMFLDNSDWLLPLKYIDFLREIGTHFRVNEMVKNEGYRRRLERKEGLSFIEFNYQLLQAFDFLTLFEKHACRLQMGGDDQWGNILAGVELVRKMRGKEVFALTFPLIETAGGHKMGKTEAGAVWLDADKVSPYEFYQYWINIDDRDAIRFLKIYTFLALEEINKLAKLKGKDLREAKEILAFEATKITHGEKEAQKAKIASEAVFGKKSKDFSDLPTVFISRPEITTGILILDLLVKAKVASSKSEAFRLINQGGIYIDKRRISDQNTVIRTDSFREGILLLGKGKKQYYRVVLK